MAARQKGGLGKGLGALLQTEKTEISADQIIHLNIQEIYPNSDQPRKEFDKAELEALAESIKESGVIIPIIVTRTEKGYLIVAGERRWRASRLAGKETIPAIIRELSDLQILQQALIENIQRQDLNPLEEAEALKRLIDDYDMKQEQLSSMVGKSRSAIANILRLLNLSEKVKDLLVHKEITAGHARALLPISDSDTQFLLAEKVLNKNLNVRETEKLVKDYLAPKKQEEQSKNSETDAYLLSVKDTEDRLMRALGTKVRLLDRKNKGKIVIEYFSTDDLERILALLDQ